MSDDTECLHGLEPAWCASCKHGPKVNEPEKADFSFAARFDSQCSECDLPIREGERTTKTTKGRYLHPECVDDHHRQIRCVKAGKRPRRL